MNPHIASATPLSERADQARVITDHPCPACAAPLLRIRRRARDRCLSLVVPVHRYRCLGFACNWEGTLRADRAAAPAVALSRTEFIFRTRQQQPSGAPA